MIVHQTVAELYAKMQKNPKNHKFFAVAMVTVYAKRSKLCMLVELEVLYIFHHYTKALSAIA